MRQTILWWSAAILLLAPALIGQTPPKRSADQIRASFESHRKEFDYLLGDWEFTATSREFGKFRGYWSAARLPGGQIVDEYRVVGDKDETYFVTQTIRAFNAALDRWELVSMDEGNGLQDIGTGQKVGPEIHIEQTFGVISQTPARWRIRYHDIQPDRFSWAGDRSTDAGKTWTKDYETIEARRTGPSRSIDALTHPKPKSE
jgi:hypothetical protein